MVEVVRLDTETDEREAPSPDDDGDDGSDGDDDGDDDDDGGDGDDGQSNKRAALSPASGSSSIPASISASSISASIF